MEFMSFVPPQNATPFAQDARRTFNPANVRRTKRARIGDRRFAIIKA